MAAKYRTHTCSELAKKDLGKKVMLSGWNHARRDHGGIIFIDLRDRYGLTQIAFYPESKKAHSAAERLKREDVITVTGTVQARPKGMENPKLATGAIEVSVDDVEVFSHSDVPPLEVDDRVDANEEQRLKYRYLDLRRPKMIKNLEFRDSVITAARDYFHQHKFIEIETPLLVRATPEGARDYVVPSRVHPGKFFALPQSPQLYKQILMVAGMDRYFQVARCLRDEDLRADRQPEHTQFDLEMSFVTSDEIREFVEGMYKYIVKKVKGIDIKENFPVIPYDEAMEKYGIDKPDLRFGLELCDVSGIVKDSDFKVFKDVIANKGIVKCINPPDLPRKEIDDLSEFCIKEGAKGMAWMRVTDAGLESNTAKFLSPAVQKKLLQKTNAKKGSILMFIADKPPVANAVLAKLRNELGRRLNMIKTDVLKFCWIVDFPLFEWIEDEQKWTPCHHMFSRPREEHIPLIEKDPGKVKADLYDLVLNGVELGSGSIRISQPDLQKRVMKVIGIDEKLAMHKFGFLIDAYRYGGPPHGGMGLGVDRFVALLLGYNDIREVIAFPKNKAAECPMDGCPSDIPDEQMRELSIKSMIVKK